MNERQEAAQLAQDYLDQKISYNLLILKYPDSEEDFDVIELFHLLERKQNGVASSGNTEEIEKLLWQQIIAMILKLSA